MSYPKPPLKQITGYVESEELNNLQFYDNSNNKVLEYGTKKEGTAFNVQCQNQSSSVIAYGLNTSLLDQATGLKYNGIGPYVCADGTYISSVHGKPPQQAVQTDYDRPLVELTNTNKITGKMRTEGDKTIIGTVQFYSPDNRLLKSSGINQTGQDLTVMCPANSFFSSIGINTRDPNINDGNSQFLGLGPFKCSDGTQIPTVYGLQPTNTAMFKKDCSLNGKAIKSYSQVKAYDDDAYDQCELHYQLRTCEDGKLSGDDKYKYDTCFSCNSSTGGPAEKYQKCAANRKSSGGSSNMMWIGLGIGGGLLLLCILSLIIYLATTRKPSDDSFVAQ